MVTLGTAGAGRSATLNAVSTAAFDGRITVSTDKIAGGGGLDVSLSGRRANNNDYRAKIKISSTGAVSLYLTRALNNVETNIAGPLAIAGLRVAANDPLAIRLKLDGSGPTVLTGKVWRASAAEPAGLAADRQRFHGGPPDGGKRGPAGVPLRIRRQRSGGDARR